MARYEYHCRTCGDDFEVSRSISASVAPVACQCGAPDAARVYTSPAVTGRAQVATAPATTGGGGGGGCCGGGCGCGAG